MKREKREGKDDNEKRGSCEGEEGKLKREGEKRGKMKRKGERWEDGKGEEWKIVREKMER